MLPEFFREATSVVVAGAQKEEPHTSRVSSVTRKLDLHGLAKAITHATAAGVVAKLEQAADGLKASERPLAGHGARQSPYALRSGLRARTSP